MNNYLLRAIFQYGKVIKLWGHVGTYAKGAPRVCGGQNQDGTVVKTCYEYNAKENYWEEMKDMKEKGGLELAGIYNFLPHELIMDQNLI